MLSNISPLPPKFDVARWGKEVPVVSFYLANLNFSKYFFKILMLKVKQFILNSIWRVIQSQRLNVSNQQSLWSNKLFQYFQNFCSQPERFLCLLSILEHLSRHFRWDVLVRISSAQVIVRQPGYLRCHIWGSRKP